MGIGVRALMAAILAVGLGAGKAHGFTGYGNSEAQISFEHWVELPDGNSTRIAARRAIDAQIQHLFGALATAPVRGAPRQNNEPPQILAIEPREDGRWIARYHYSGTFVLERGRVSDLGLALPNNPATVWRMSNELKLTEVNPCTDEDYFGLGDFWYFWSPFRKGCRRVLKLGRHYSFVVNPKIERVRNSERSFPEYEHLADSSGRIEVTLIVGKDDPSRIRSPMNRKIRANDDNAVNFDLTGRGLEEMGFEGREWTLDEVKRVVRAPLNPYPFVKEFVFNYGEGARATVLAIRLVFATTAIDRQSRGFHFFLEEGLERSAVLIYDGHSGLGGNLDLHEIRESVDRVFNFNLNKDRYQIYFFNSCSSYSYFNDLFFAKKRIEGARDRKGSRYLDILTTGLETDFVGSERVNIALVRAIHTWALGGKKTSYQELAREMEANNLFGVNGDEDNP